MGGKALKRSIVFAAAIFAAACGEAETPAQSSSTDPTSEEAQKPQLAEARSIGILADASPPPLPMQGAASPANVIRLQRVEIMDPSGFERPMVAFNALIPVGWKLQGGVLWDVNGGCVSGFNMDWTADSPDGRMGAATFRGFGWQASNVPGSPPMAQGAGCIQVRLNSVREYLTYLAQTSRQGARILDYRERPDLVKGLEIGNTNLAFPGGGGRRSWSEAGEILIGYQFNGVEMRETLSSTVFFSFTQMPDLMGNVSEIFVANAMPGFAFRAPDGQLDFKLAEAIRKSTRSVPDWQQRVNKGNEQVAKVPPVDPTLIAREGAKRSAIIAQTGDQIREMTQQTMTYQNNVSSGMQTSNVETIRGVETYNDPQSTTGTVELSNQYQNAWRMQDGSYVLTDDPSFNPYLSLGQDGAKLEPTQ